MLWDSMCNNPFPTKTPQKKKKKSNIVEAPESSSYPGGSEYLVINISHAERKTQLFRDSLRASLHSAEDF